MYPNLAAHAAPVQLHSSLDVSHHTLPVAGGASCLLQETAIVAGGCESLAVGVGGAGSCHIDQVALDFAVGQCLALGDLEEAAQQCVAATACQHGMQDLLDNLHAVSPIRIG